MNKVVRAGICAAMIAGALLVPAVGRAQSAIPGACVPGVLPSHALSLICVPGAGWNGELVVFAHGYAAPGPTLDFSNLTLLDGTSLPLLVQSLGYAFATTSYRQNGLAILEGADDMRELVGAFKQTVSTPLKTHLAGVSEGGLVAALLAEQSPEIFSSALAACGPIGSFTLQLDYSADFRVLFDYFFPGLIPGSPIDIPAGVVTNWETLYLPRITAALLARPDKALELMRTSNAAYDPAAPATIVNTTIDLLRYNVVATNDAIAKLGGNPFGNATRWYFGSSNDRRLNLQIQRFKAAPAARRALKAYETSGDLRIPMVSLHTVADDVVPAWHEILYLAKADAVPPRGKFLPFPVLRYGHCNFTAAEIAAAFSIAVRQP
jgi:pimeloyl-ACP methyl ester carboxylesterase